MKETLKYLDEIIEKYDLKKKSRKREHLYKRQYISWFCVKVLSFTYEITADLIGYKDHTSPLYNCNNVDNWFELKDEMFLSIIFDIENDLAGCPIPKKSNENVFLTLINRLFEVKDMEDVEGLKAYVNENINPKMLK